MVRDGRVHLPIIVSSHDELLGGACRDTNRDIPGNNRTIQIVTLYRLGRCCCILSGCIHDTYFHKPGISVGSDTSADLPGLSYALDFKYHAHPMTRKNPEFSYTHRTVKLCVFFFNARISFIAYFTFVIYCRLLRDVTKL